MSTYRDGRAYPTRIELAAGIAVLTLMAVAYIAVILAVIHFLGAGVVLAFFIGATATAGRALDWLGRRNADLVTRVIRGPGTRDRSMR